MKVKADIEYAEVESDSGRPIDGLRVACSRCGHSVEVMGETISSARLGAIMLRDECPNGENNYYDVEWWSA
jgi:ribosomal protein S27AE